MKTKIIAVAALSASVLVVGVNCFPQAPAPCIIGRADAHRYIVKYTPKPGQTFDPSCSAKLRGEWWEDLWMNKYFIPPNQGEPLNKIAVRPTRFTKQGVLADGGVGGFVPGNIDPDATHVALAEGDFESASEKTGEGGLSLCTVPTLNPVRQDLQGGALPVTYQWSNMKFLSGAVYQGTMMGADLTLTEGTCTVQYDAVAIWPGDKFYPLQGAVLPHECSSDEECQDPSLGLNPEYDLACLGAVAGPPPTAGRCTARKPFPSLKE